MICSVCGVHVCGECVRCVYVHGVYVCVWRGCMRVRGVCVVCMCVACMRVYVCERGYVSMCIVCGACVWCVRI